ncbi:MAG: hypothetical protein ABIQ95_05470 [Bdellovibrionia bacterium]
MNRKVALFSSIALIIGSIVIYCITHSPTGNINKNQLSNFLDKTPSQANDRRDPASVKDPIHGHNDGSAFAAVGALGQVRQAFAMAGHQKSQMQQNQFFQKPQIAREHPGPVDHKIFDPPHR